jgi:hypothetical protein
VPEGYRIFYLDKGVGCAIEGTAMKYLVPIDAF